MDKESIDASTGLAFSLMLFERYRKTGLLQAELKHSSKTRRRYKGYLHLTEGKVTSCYLEDGQGQRHPMSKEQMIELDRGKGPFEWTLTPLPASPTPAHAPSVTNASVPQRIAPLDLEKLQGWSAMQKMMLLLIFEAINEQRSLEEIKTVVPLAPTQIEEGLRILFILKVVSF